MKLLYLECNMGASGDMLMAALLELYPDKEGFINKINSLLTDVSVTCAPSVKCGIKGSHISVKISDYEEESDDICLDAELREPTEFSGTHTDIHPHEHAHLHTHSHTHEHEHDHEHSQHSADEDGHAQFNVIHGLSLKGIYDIIDSLDLPEQVKRDTRAVYQIIADAESHVHAVTVEQVHFHEVGTLDAVIDIAGVCLLFYLLAPEKIIASPVHVGFGTVRCAHGMLPVPAPATAEILKGVPTYGGKIRGELCTPTGAALLRHFAGAFGGMPTTAVSAVGYGMGKKDFEAANCMRVFLGDCAAESSDEGIDEAGGADEIDELCCNLDDMTPEAIGYASDMLFEAGALDVFSTPIQMKKNRPAVLFTCLCRPKDTERLTLLILKHTTTIGVRKKHCDRTILQSSHTDVQTPYGEIRIKESRGHGIFKCKPEFEDVRRAADRHGITAEEVQRAALAAHEKL